MSLVSRAFHGRRRFNADPMRVPPGVDDAESATQHVLAFSDGGYTTTTTAVSALEGPAVSGSSR